VQQVAEVVEQRRGDDRGRVPVPLGQRRALQGVFELRDGLAVVLGGAARRKESLDAGQDRRGSHACSSHQSPAIPKESVIPAPPGATAITHPGCGSIVTNDRVGCFAYSPVEGAAANDLPEAVPEDLREARRARLMQVQAQISARRLASRVGRIERVLIDRQTAEGGIGRTCAEAPEIDGVVHLTCDTPAQVGSFYDARIVRSDEHDLFAVHVTQAAQAQRTEGEIR